MCFEVLKELNKFNMIMTDATGMVVSKKTGENSTYDLIRRSLLP